DGEHRQGRRHRPPAVPAVAQNGPVRVGRPRVRRRRLAHQSRSPTGRAVRPPHRSAGRRPGAEQPQGGRVRLPVPRPRVPGALGEIDLPGERKGFAKILKRQPLTLNDLPPMPPDVSRFSSLRLDPEATYEAGLSLFEVIGYNESLGVEDQGKSPAEVIKLRK